MQQTVSPAAMGPSLLRPPIRSPGALWWRLAASALLCGPAVSWSQVTPLDRQQLEQERLRKLIEGKPKAYEDRFLETSATESAVDQTLTSATVPPDGLRSTIIEGRATQGQNRDGALALRSAQELGTRVLHRRETLNHGEWILEADWRHRQGDAGTVAGNTAAFGPPDGQRLTVRNLGFPLTEHWFVDSVAGDFTAEITDALARSSRSSLGGSVVRGLGARLYAPGFDVRLGAGRIGSLSGGPFPGFEPDGNARLRWIGSSYRFNPQLFAGFQLMDLHRAPADDGEVPATVDPAFDRVRSMAFAVGHGQEPSTDGQHRLRFVAIHSDSRNGSTGRHSASGWALEGAWRYAGLRHEGGLYGAQPGLRFGDRALSADNRGAYWRVDGKTGPVNWGLGADYELTNPAAEPGRSSGRRTGLSSHANWRIDRRTNLGFSIASQSTRPRGAESAASAQGMSNAHANVWLQTEWPQWGRSRFGLVLQRNRTLVADAPTATGEEIQWEHDWVTGRFETLRPEFTTVLGWARDRSTGDTQTYPTAGVNFRAWLDADWSIQGLLRMSSRSGNLSTSRGLSGSLSTERRLSATLRGGATLQLNQARVSTTPQPGGEPLPVRSDDRSVQVWLRWEQGDGAPYGPIGVRNSGFSGSGDIEGVVYFDHNRDDHRQIDEAGVAGVEVVLDKRYRTTTDRDGRFVFPLVTTGPHQLTLTLETVPLPWGSPPNPVTAAVVPLRGTASIHVPVVRLSE